MEISRKARSHNNCSNKIIFLKKIRILLSILRLPRTNPKNTLAPEIHSLNPKPHLKVLLQIKTPNLRFRRIMATRIRTRATAKKVRLNS